MKAVAIKAKKELDISKKEVGFHFQSKQKDQIQQVRPLIVLSLSLFWLTCVSGGKSQ